MTNDSPCRLDIRACAWDRYFTIIIVDVSLVFRLKIISAVMESGVICTSRCTALPAALHFQHRCPSSTAAPPAPLPLQHRAHFKPKPLAFRAIVRLLGSYLASDTSATIAWPTSNRICQLTVNKAKPPDVIKESWRSSGSMMGESSPFSKLYRAM